MPLPALPGDSTGGPSRNEIALTVIGVCCVGLVLWLKIEGIALAALIMAMSYAMLRRGRSSTESAALETSIRLSADDIRDVLDEYNLFLTGQTADQMADRQLHRPALTDPDCDNETIEAFFFHAATAERFLARLEARLAGDLTVQQLETILMITDKRAFEIRESWIEARRAALRLGADYKPPGLRPKTDPGTDQ